MPADRFKRLQAIFDAALEQPVEARETYVRVACGDDRELADEIVELLVYETRIGETGAIRPFALVVEAFDAAKARSLIGSVVGRYRLESEIASGGMGRVFKARRIDGDVAQTVALKLVREEMFNPALLKRFSAERKILASLSHPGIAHLIDAGTDERGTPYVAMEYVDGLPLLEYCAQGGLSVRERIELFRRMLAAVSHAHRNLVVHRDLKPSNILITPDGLPKLLDFGIAKQLDLGHEETATAHRFFTPAFAAPEQLGDGHVSVACDVYGLGAVLYMLLTGAPPFDLSGASPAEIERRIRMVPPSPMRATVLARGESAIPAIGGDQADKWAMELGGDLEQIVQKALRKEPESRYVSIDQFDEDLQRYLERRPVLASGSGWLYRTRKFCERNALAVSFTLAFVIASALGVAQLLRQNEEIRLERDRATLALGVLQNSFSSADPMRLGAGDIRARTILTSAAREISVLEKRRPALFRDLAYRIGEIQLNLGITKDGLALIQRANKTLARPPDAGLLLEIRGLIMGNQLVRARAAIDANRVRFAGNDEFLAEEAHLLYLEKSYDESILICRNLLAQESVKRAPNLRDRIYWYTAEAYRLSEREKDAVAVLERQIVEQARRYGDEHPATLISRLRRLDLLATAGDASAAERELKTIKPVLDRHYDRMSAVQAQYHNIFGQILNAQNRSQEALAHFRESLATSDEVLGPNHENTFRAHFNVAQIIAYTMSDRSEAYPHFLKAIAGVEATKGRSDSLNGFFRAQAATSYYWDQDKDSARRLLAPSNAIHYFPKMPPENQANYLAALYYGFGPQDCTPGWERTVGTGSEPLQIARILMCRYDPERKNKPVD